MTLDEFYRRNSIAGFKQEELRDILGLRSEYQVSYSPPNGIMLNKDGKIKILGCVAKYFTNNKNGKKLKMNKSGSTTGACYYIQKELGCNNIATPGECRTCFLACLSKLDGDVYRINK